MSNRKRYSFSEQTNELGEKNLVPMLPLSLMAQNQSIQEWGLLDTGPRNKLDKDGQSSIQQTNCGTDRSTQQDCPSLSRLYVSAAVNVLPYRMGLALGLNWETQKTPVQLGGILAQVPAYGVLLSVTIDEFPPVKLVFAWTEAENIPLILGRMNFFKVFDVCFYGAQDRF